MHAVDIPAGTKGTLIYEDSTTRNWVMRKTIMFFSEDIVVDPVRLHNDKHQGIYKAPTTKQDQLAECYALQGHTVFQQEGPSGQRYYFATNLNLQYR